VLKSAKNMPWNDPLRARLVAGEGVTLASGEASVKLGHLEGWGGYDRLRTPSFARSEGAPARRRVEWVVRGEGTVTIEASAARVGAVRESLRVG
jgi:hypothetical protein